VKLLKEYYKELWGYDVISEGKAFIAYTIKEDESILWINELYVPKAESKGTGPLKRLALKVEDIAKKNNKSGVAAQIILINHAGGVHSDPTRIVKIMLYWGFKIVGSEKNAITLYKKFSNNKAAIQE
jgi:hypothetical protein|tara:strand:+ start:1568 stop:1948 length:381 start_codon:yes stop_codon:yes gene_type:complete